MLDRPFDDEGFQEAIFTGFNEQKELLEPVAHPQGGEDFRVVADPAEIPLDVLVHLPGHMVSMVNDLVTLIGSFSGVSLEQLLADSSTILAHVRPRKMAVDHLTDVVVGKSIHLVQHKDAENAIEQLRTISKLMLLVELAIDLLVDLDWLNANWQLVFVGKQFPTWTFVSRGDNQHHCVERSTPYAKKFELLNNEYLKLFPTQ